MISVNAEGMKVRHVLEAPRLGVIVHDRQRIDLDRHGLEAKAGWRAAAYTEITLVGLAEVS